jgi:hypothetical protein
VNANGERRGLALLACGALAREVREIVWAHGWDADLHTAPALNHLSPKRIVASVDAKLADLTRRYERVIVVYGDCGTGGALDEVLRRHGAVRTVGPHCYEMYGHPDVLEVMRERPGTFFLTDWLVRNWERAAVEGLGIDRFPNLKGVYFDHCTDVLYLRQSPEAHLEARAREIAEFLGLPLEIRDVGLGDLERRLTDLVDQ